MRSVTRATRSYIADLEESVLLLCEMVEHCLDYPELNNHEQRQREFRAAIAAQRISVGRQP